MHELKPRKISHCMFTEAQTPKEISKNKYLIQMVILQDF